MIVRHDDVALQRSAGRGKAPLGPLRKTYGSLTGFLIIQADLSRWPRRATRRWSVGRRVPRHGRSARRRLHGRRGTALDPLVNGLATVGSIAGARLPPDAHGGRMCLGG